MIPVCAISRATPGVWYQNDPQLVKELVELLWLKGDEPVTVEVKLCRCRKPCSGILS